ncbi:MAG TPA: hypothetical protein VKS60_14460, partial [Stellaceae bacterium]|nr:hypothetical protein [Stellaceae bacterium]
EWTVRVNDGAVNGGHPITPQPRTPAAMTGGPFTVADALRPYLILADPSGGAVSVTLSSSPSTGQMVWVKDVTGAAGTNAITISGGTIDGSASLVINSNYGEALLVASIYGWSIIR